MSKALIVCGLGWGDESKGATTDALTREFNADLIVRYNGGAQAAHNVITPEGVHHTFAQFGSGMLANNKVRTHLSRFMLVNPLNMMNEADELAKKTTDPWGRVTVDPRAVIITPIHRRINQIRESARGDARHGSCGQGIGVAREWQIKYDDSILYAEDLWDTNVLQSKLRFLEDIAMLEVGAVALRDIDVNAFLEPYIHWRNSVHIGSIPKFDCAVFEGAQGVLLDEKHGQVPHNTWTNTTFENADTLLDEVGVKNRTRIGCLRTYHTRHGAGPFPTENNSLDLPEPHNGTGEYQGAFRVGDFDSDAAKRAIEIVGWIDGLSLSHIDYLDRIGYHYPDEEIIRMIGEKVGAPIMMKANGPTADHRTVNLGVYA